MPILLSLLPRRARKYDKLYNRDSLKPGSVPDLPPELIFKILSCIAKDPKFNLSPTLRQTLMNAILVCRDWCACGNPLLYKRVCLLSESAALSMAKTLKRCPELGHLVEFLSFTTPPSLVLNRNGDLQRMPSTYVHIKQSLSDAIVRACPNLDTLSVHTETVREVEAFVNKTQIAPGALQLESLRSLHLRGPDLAIRATASSFMSLITSLATSSCLKLEELSLEYFYFSDADLPSALPWQNALQHLRILRLAQCDITPSVFTTFVSWIKSSLRTLELDSTWTLTTPQVIESLSQVPHLTHFSLIGIKKVDTNIKFSGLQSLKVLDIEAVHLVQNPLNLHHPIADFPPNVEILRTHVHWSPSEFEALIKQHSVILPNTTKRWELTIYAEEGNVPAWREVGKKLSKLNPKIQVGTRMRITLAVSAREKEVISTLRAAAIA